MKICTEENLRHFEFWSGASILVEALTCEELDSIETELEGIYPDGIDETDLNDLFCFKGDWIAQMLGYGSEEELLKRDANKNEEE